MAGVVPVLSPDSLKLKVANPPLPEPVVPAILAAVSDIDVNSLLAVLRT